ncbi:uncharacterized protein CTRU02_210645 [Colletotrichum truncatum]|uniref:Uncharacterized protein n=1 Tax=Colletotrichum truncatum TaxID=5467 RepID=A0ACC3YQV1_COLTU|nr:uncharacterized protein CTRU02_03860 [Colletotrichum truncatum]KAF6796882.1 hypothetical protein CTRU02_03860 [Colletotrichum truncatum]
MSGRRDRGTTVITAEERVRRATEAKTNIREAVAFTPALLGRVHTRIDSNAFRRCISDNAIYQSLCNSLKDKNLPERERRPDLVDFLALEAIIPVQYGGEYNRVLKDLYIRCNTENWAEKAVLDANHDWYQDRIGDAKNFIRSMIKKVDSQLLEIILEDIETNFWREKVQDNVLYKKVTVKMLEKRQLSQRDVLTMVAINGGKYPTELFRHLVVKQNSEMLNYGNNLHAQHDLYDDQEYQGSAAQAIIPGNAPLTQSIAQSGPAIDGIIELEAIAEAMQNKHKSREVRKKLQELKELLKDDYPAINAVQSGRVHKPSGSGTQPSRLGSRARQMSSDTRDRGLFVNQAERYFSDNDEHEGTAQKPQATREMKDDEQAKHRQGPLGQLGTPVIKKEPSSHDEYLFLSRTSAASY